MTHILENKKSAILYLIVYTEQFGIQAHYSNYWEHVLDVPIHNFKKWIMNSTTIINIDVHQAHTQK